MASKLKDEIAGYDLLPIVERDAPQIEGSFNGRYTREVACPKCGGKTRFRLRLCDDGIQRAYCSHCAPSGMDAIAYIQWRDGVDFKQARAFWGNKGATNWTPARAFKPAPARTDRAPNETWQAKARAFVDACAAELWTPAGAPALDYLRRRGLSDDTIRRRKLGYNRAKRSAQGASWGLSDRAKVTAVAGITIPREIAGELWAVNVRRMNPDGTQYSGKDKYICITGSVLGLWGADSVTTGAPALAFGGEFDAMLAAQHAPAGVGCVTFGGEGHGVSELWRNILARALAVHVCLDNDTAGDVGVMRWMTLPQARRARVPDRKDLTEYAQAGGDVAAWIARTIGAAAGDISTEMPSEPQPDVPPAAEIAPEIEPPADEIAMIAIPAIVGYLSNEGPALPSELAQHVALATGWELTAGVKAQIAGAMKALVKCGRAVLCDDKRLALAQG